jgi:hypothetical protein
MDIQADITALLVDYGVIVKVTGADGTNKFTSVCFEAPLKTANDGAQQAMLTVRTKRTLYMPAIRNKIPAPGDVVSYGKKRARVITATEYALQGSDIFYRVEVQ